MTTASNGAHATLSGGRDKYLRLEGDAWGLINNAPRVRVTADWTDDGLLIRWQGAVEDNEATHYGSPYKTLALRHTISGVRFVANRLLKTAGANTDEVSAEDRSGPVVAYDEGWFGVTIRARRLGAKSSATA